MQLNIILLFCIIISQGALSRIVDPVFKNSDVCSVAISDNISLDSCFNKKL